MSDVGLSKAPNHDVVRELLKATNSKAYVFVCEALVKSRWCCGFVDGPNELSEVVAIVVGAVVNGETPVISVAGLSDDTPPRTVGPFHSPTPILRDPTPMLVGWPVKW